MLIKSHERMMNSEAYTGTFQDSSPTTIISRPGYIESSGGDDVVDWTTDCVRDGSDMMAISSSAIDYDDDINDEVRAMLESDDYLDTFTAEFESRYVNSGGNAEALQYDTNVAYSSILDAEYNISIGQPTCETRDKKGIEYFSSENDPVNVDRVQYSTTLRKRGVASGKGPSHRTAKKKSKGLPKRPLSKYNLFFQNERLKILEEASKNHTRISFENLAKIIGKRWHDLSEEDSEKFRILSELDIARYREEMKAYHSKLQNSTPGTKCITDDQMADTDDNFVKKTQSICHPKSPSSPRRKRKYSDSSSSTAGSANFAEKSARTVTHKVSASPTLCPPDGVSPKDDAPINETANTMSDDQKSSSNECSAPLATEEKTAFQVNAPRKLDLNLPYLSDDVAGAVVVAIPPSPPKHEYAGLVEHISAVKESDHKLPPQQQFYNDLYDSGPNRAFLPPHLRSYHPYHHSVSPNGSHPYHSSSVRPPRPPPPPHYVTYGYHPRLHYYSNSCHNNNMYRSMTLPPDHNKEIMIYDPKIKQDRRFKIQYKCFAMKRSEANSYLSRLSSSSSPATTTEAVSPTDPSTRQICINNFFSHGGNTINISMQQLLQQISIPGVEVDLSNHRLPGPMRPRPRSKHHPLPVFSVPLHQHDLPPKLT